MEYMKCIECGAPMELSKSNDTVFFLICSKVRSHRSLHASDTLVAAIQTLVANFNPTEEQRVKKKEFFEEGADLEKLVGAMENAQFNSNRSMTTKEAARFLAVSSNMIRHFKRAGLPYHKMGKSFTFTMADLIQFRKNFRYKDW